MSVLHGPVLLAATGLLFGAPLAHAQSQAAEPPRAVDPPVVQTSEDGFSLSSADKAFVLKTRGQLQGDGRFYFDDTDRTGTNTFVMRRVRPILDGTLFGFIDFRFMPDFGNGQPLIQDAWIDFRPGEWIRLRAGRFKTPFGLELLQSDMDNPFIERSLTVDLVPNRDEGLELHGEGQGGRWQYSLAVVNGDPDGTSTDFNGDDSFDLVARVFALPFKGIEPSFLQGLGLGFAVTRGLQFGSATNTGLVPQRSTGQEVIFSYLSNADTGETVVAHGQHLRVSPQGYFYWGSLGVLAEYVRSTQDVQVADARARLRNHAWQASASWVFGGRASFEGAKPTKPFDPKTGQGGALEVAARYHALDLDEAAFPRFANPARSVRTAKGFGVATTFAFNRRVRFAVNYHRTNYQGGAPNGGDRKPENVVLSRFQLTF
ncbi:OprO/OprP family phosphate-selective porin [Corallococcus sp. Z5C101001]|uniref:OprO/OprP family phosphate-selective porin n=1 Tax=Corallococcus sp. Z5C101001 TaxID=2596829 RepID=UPI0011804B94|nr:porin [Corallococcus sp. Z5C101001]TSC22647.1 outer membrane beta-barrel protein [Corallococcus sp. Z5C101001]